MGYFHLTEGKRHSWKVKVKASRLAQCCEERMSYHNARIAFWDKERKAAEEELRSKGLQLRHFAVTGGERMEAQLDTGLAKRVSECERRLNEHRSAIDKFRAYKAFFALSSEEHDLTADDVLYFNLEGADNGSDEAGD